MPNYTVVDEARDLIKPYVDTGDSAQESLTRSTVGWTGKNIADISKADVGTAWNGDTNSARARLIVPCAASTKYTASISGTALEYVGYVTSPTEIPSQTSLVTMSGTTADITTGASDKYIIFGFNKTAIAQSDLDALKFMITDASIKDSTYEPYHESVEVEFEEEIHGVNLVKTSLEALKATNTTGTWNNNAYTIYGVTFTVNSDLTITMNGKNTNSSGAIMNIDLGDLLEKIKVSGKDYMFTCCPPNGSLATYRAHISGINTIDYGEGFIVNSSNISQNVLNMHRIGIGTYNTENTMSNVVFKPQIYKEELGSNLPYHPYNSQSIQNQINDKGVLGAKNLLPNNAATQTSNGITYTVNSDKTVTVNGTASEYSEFVQFASGSLLPDSLKAGETYIISGCEGGSSYDSDRTANTFYIFFNYYDANGNLVGGSVSSKGERTFTIPNNAAKIRGGIAVYQGQTFSNKVFKPMIRLASDPDDTYVPYAMTNRELTPQKIATAPANQTWGAQLEALKTAYNALTDIKKAKVYCINGDNGDKFTVNALSTGCITATVLASIGDIIVYCGRIDNNKMIKINISSEGAVTRTDISNTNNNNALNLYA